MAGPLVRVLKVQCIIFLVLCGLAGFVGLIMTFAMIKTLENDEQFVIQYLQGNEVVNGPKGARVYNPFREMTRRKGVTINGDQFARVFDTMIGVQRLVDGPRLLFLGPYEELVRLESKIVLRRDQYIRLLDSVTLEERVVRGPASFVPQVFEWSEEGAQNVIYVSPDEAVVVLNKLDGTERLEITVGPFFPNPYEIVLHLTSVIRLLPHQSMVVRDAMGRFVVHSGAGVTGTESGKAFFLRPFEEIVTMRWSSFSQPAEGGVQEVGTVDVSLIDLRMRKVFFQYQVRTNDNVALQVEGSIFWQVVDVAKLVIATADPAGDVWFKVRGAVVSAVGKVSFERFMSSFQSIITSAFEEQVADGFYEDRGLDVSTIEVTKYSPKDDMTARTLQDIIQETTNRLNRIKTQESTNDVNKAQVYGEILYETRRTKLIETQAANQRMLASLEGEAEGLELAAYVSQFFDQLNTTLPDIDDRVGTYKFMRELQSQNRRTFHIATGSAELFMTADNLAYHLQSLAM